MGISQFPPTGACQATHSMSGFLKSVVRGELKQRELEFDFFLKGGSGGKGGKWG